MPGGDRTGPMGEGPRTGRGAGYCGGWREAGFTTAPGGRGFGRGRGFGAGRGWGRGGPRRWGRRFDAPLPESDEQAEPPRGGADTVRARIESLEKRLARLEKTD